MKRCGNCGGNYVSSLERCAHCGSSPARVNGFAAYAPDFCRESSGFKASYFSDLARLEEGNFWFRGRNELIVWALRKYCPELRSFLEVGCGTGYVLSGIARAYPDAVLRGSEIFTDGLGFAAARLPGADFMQMDARDIPFDAEFSAVGAFDVLEHIEEDQSVLAEIHRALEPGGLLLLTVPQHAWLWSEVDDYACHVRRYSAQELHRKVHAAGFEILRSTSFVSSLLPAMMISRLIGKKSARPDEASAELALPPVLNRLFLFLLRIDLACIKAGMRLPLGGSRLVVARRMGN